MLSINYLNPLPFSPEHVFHKTYYSQILDHEIGYYIYLPPDYEETDHRYPVFYHLHGWTGNESSDVLIMEKCYRHQQTIFVFPNNSPVLETREHLPIEDVIIQELIPHIDDTYRTFPTRENRFISGFSMGGGMAFYYAVKYPTIFSAVTAYAGTYHHYYHRDYLTVGTPFEKAPELYQTMIREKKYFEKSIIQLLNNQAAAIRNHLKIILHIGTKDVLFCDNEILRLHLEALCIPHEYKIIPGAAHSLSDIL